jgi:F420-non-reducing hydrogenase small subunit
MKKLATVGCCCAGCHVAVLDLHEKILPMLKNVEISYSYIISDVKTIPNDLDIAIVEGGIRTEHDEALVKEVRKKAKSVIALGSCACFGGLPSLANIYDNEEMLNYVYTKTQGTSGVEIPREEIPRVTQKQEPISSYIKVDYEIPGCPPEPNDIALVLGGILSGEKVELAKKSVCDECERNRLEKPPATIRRLFEEPDDKRCLLEQGYFCMGPATRSGCKAKCPNASVPCDGCRGPTVESWDQGLAMLDALSTIAYENVKDYNLATHTGIFHRYTFATSLLSKLQRLTERR